MNWGCGGNPPVVDGMLAAGPHIGPGIPGAGAGAVMDGAGPGAGWLIIGCGCGCGCGAICGGGVCGATGGWYVGPIGCGNPG